MPYCGKTMDRKRNKRLRRGRTTCYSCGRNLTMGEVKSFVENFPFKICDACASKDSTRLTDEPVNSGSCNDGDLAPKCERS
jgi:hypothetical protein